MVGGVFGKLHTKSGGINTAPAHFRQGEDPVEDLLLCGELHIPERDQPAAEMATAFQGVDPNHGEVFFAPDVNSGIERLSLEIGKVIRIGQVLRRVFVLTGCEHFIGQERAGIVRRNAHILL